MEYPKILFVQERGEDDAMWLDAQSSIQDIESDGEVAVYKFDRFIKRETKIVVEEIKEK